ncbi:RNA polymerase sigma factor [Patescibacteria group bacterium]|nr:RNA polymerase sigma factor [Patescibacteria group bacterium]MCH7756703.1 RNA polymerase sigma factor [Patescibacteria group bacterium]
MNLLGDTETNDTISEKSDEEVLALSVSRPHVFEVILDRYQEALLRKAESILRSREDAEDIVQETFAKIYLNAYKFKIQEGASFKSWAYKILVNTAFTRYQKMKRERGVRLPLDPEIYETLRDTESRQFEKQEVSEYIISVLSRIPDHLSRVLYLHIIEGRPQEEVARMEDISVGAVKTRVHRAKKAFKKENAALI